MAQSGFSLILTSSFRKRACVCASKLVRARHGTTGGVDYCTRCHQRTSSVASRQLLQRRSDKWKDRQLFRPFSKGEATIGKIGNRFVPSPLEKVPSACEADEVPLWVRKSTDLTNIHHRLCEEGVGPGEPGAGEGLGFVLVEAFVHEAGAGVCGEQGVEE
jgi:hypothetical protein